MLKFKESPAGYLLYFVSIAVNFLVLILRISAQEMNFATVMVSTTANMLNTTGSTNTITETAATTVVADVVTLNSTIDDNTTAVALSMFLMCTTILIKFTFYFFV